MRRRTPKDIVASVRGRLLNLARNSGKPFEQTLILYGLERFLFRLSKTSYKDKLILKGGLLLVGLRLPQARPTRDIDFLGLMEGDIEDLSNAIRQIGNRDFDDGLKFDFDELSYEIMSPDSEAPGLRFKFFGYLGQARIPMQIDVGFGDIVVPETKEIDFPTLLDMEPPKLLAYSLESVVAEKFEAALDLADLNSRMKDFYDIRALSHRYSFDGLVLQEAIVATCSRRNTPIHVKAELFSRRFADRPDKQTQWGAFIRKGMFDSVPEGFAQLMTEVGSFLLPVAKSCENNVSFSSTWQPGGPWSGNSVLLG